MKVYPHFFFFFSAPQSRLDKIIIYHYHFESPVHLCLGWKGWIALWSFVPWSLLQSSSYNPSIMSVFAPSCWFVKPLQRVGIGMLWTNFHILKKKFGIGRSYSFILYSHLRTIRVLCSSGAWPTIGEHITQFFQNDGKRVNGTRAGSYASPHIMLCVTQHLHAQVEWRG